MIVGFKVPADEKLGLRLDRGSARSDPLLAQLGAADGASGDKREEGEHAGIYQSADQDLDRDSDQERENRAEQGSHGNRPNGPGWETAHAATLATPDRGYLA
jgi:hypothetical protein